MPTEQLTTGEKIRVLASRQDIDIQDLARASGITPEGFHYNLRKNNWKLPLLEKVAAILNVDIKDLV